MKKDVIDVSAFKVGDTVLVKHSVDGKAFVGKTGKVVALDGEYVTVTVAFAEQPLPGYGWSDSKGNSVCWNFFDDGDLQVVTNKQPSVADDLKLTPQAKSVLLHLRKRDHISNMEALITYGISRLAACIYEIRKVGYDVVSEAQRDEQGHKYTKYRLAKAVH